MNLMVGRCRDSGQETPFTAPTPKCKPVKHPIGLETIGAVKHLPATAPVTVMKVLQNPLVSRTIYRPRFMNGGAELPRSGG